MRPSHVLYNVVDDAQLNPKEKQNIDIIVEMKTKYSYYVFKVLYKRFLQPKNDQKVTIEA